jgi:hypothetical protein
VTQIILSAASSMSDGQLFMVIIASMFAVAGIAWLAGRMV